MTGTKFLGGPDIQYGDFFFLYAPDQCIPVNRLRIVVGLIVSFP